MKIDAERIAALTDKELDALDTNASRLEVSGTQIQRTEAERLRPIIDEETAKRRAIQSEARLAAAAKRATNLKKKKSNT